MNHKRQLPQTCRFFHIPHLKYYFFILTNSTSLWKKFHALPLFSDCYENLNFKCSETQSSFTFFIWFCSLYLLFFCYFFEECFKIGTELGAFFHWVVGISECVSGWSENLTQKYHVFTRVNLLRIFDIEYCPEAKFYFNFKVKHSNLSQNIK